MSSPPSKLFRARTAAYVVICPAVAVGVAMLLARLHTVEATTIPAAEHAVSVPTGEPVPTGGSAPARLPMPERLAALQAAANPRVNAFINSARAAMWRQELEAAPATRVSLQQVVAYASELFYSGEFAMADQQFAAIGGQLARQAVAGAPVGDYIAMVDMFRATVALRYGEDRNCVGNHTGESCLLPIRGGGVHRDRTGSANAAELLEGMLARSPENLTVRWLLNVAHMTLGSWPDGVPARWRIEPAAFESPYDIGRFPNVAPEAGVSPKRNAGSVVVDDFDADGLLDILCSAMGQRDQMLLYRNTGDGRFADVSDAAGLAGQVFSLNIVPADYDNDGDTDILVLRGGWFGAAGVFPSGLLRNDGGRFTDVTDEVGFDVAAPTQTAAWLDFDLDGDLDVFVGQETSPEYAPGPCKLFRNDAVAGGPGRRFVECAADAGVAVVGYVKGVTAGDYDNDGRPDLYISRFDQTNVLLRNAGPSADGRVGFVDMTAAAGVAEPLKSFPTFFFDYDNDGWLDLFVSGYQSGVEDVAADYLGLPGRGLARPRLYRNRGDGTFVDIAAAAGLDLAIETMGVGYGDLDNDGWLDFYCGTGNPRLDMLVPNRMFRADGQGRFQDVTFSGGFGHLQKGHGVAFADVDNDGDQDVYESLGGAYEVDTAHNALFLNPGHLGNHFLTLKIEGTTENRGAYGARVTVTVDTPTGPRRVHRAITSGTSFGNLPSRQEIGLGDATGVRSVEVFWPRSGRTEVLTGLSLDRMYRIREGDAVATPVTMVPAPLAAAHGVASGAKAEDCCDPATGQPKGK